MTPEQIDHVILVGGSSYIPLVRKSLAEVFGEAKLVTTVDPLRSVAFGAALLAAKLVANPECSMVTPEVTEVHYGTQTQGDKFEVIIPRGTTIPTPEPLTRCFRVSVHGLRRIGLPIYAGHDQVASRNELLATLWLELPENLPAGTPVEISFGLDRDGILEFRASLSDGSGTAIVTYLGRGASRDRWERKVDRLLRLKHALRSQVTVETEQRWQGLYARAIQALSGNDLHAAEGCAAEMEELLQYVRRSQG
ncbi:MAG: Hsp70 family protein [Candidatus Eisenbacteria bacterium]|uniref:Hsp70 family protein n=1 Tax=Eiseniibacteriota bacterium TaxID=2212470 RepID=A0A937XAP6_UNCEI|nr:Hsp70 family protein [Candidatus Eisenbacteria bacterium]